MEVAKNFKQGSVTQVPLHGVNADTGINVSLGSHWNSDHRAREMSSPWSLEQCINSKLLLDTYFW